MENITVETVWKTVETVRNKLASTWKSGRKGKVLVIGAALMLCFACIGVVSIFSDSTCERTFSDSTYERTVSDFRAECIRDFNKDLSRSNSKLRKFIEYAHVTVTVKSANITRCEVTTIDGTEKAGKNNSNIAEVSMLIRFLWEGIIDTGYTDLRILWDAQSNSIIKSKIEYTTAWINTQDPDLWWNVGYAIGTIIGSAL